MKLGKFSFFSAIILSTILFTAVNILNVNFFFLKPVISFLFLAIVPGLLAIHLFKIKSLEFWEYISYTIGLSLSYLIINGLLLNTLLPFFGIKPLTLLPLLLSIDLYVALTSLLVYM